MRAAGRGHDLPEQPGRPVEGGILVGDRSKASQAIDKVKETLKGDDPNAIRQALNNLQSAAHALAQHVGRAAGAPGAEGGPPPGDRPTGSERGKDDVIDAEFEVKK